MPQISRLLAIGMISNPTDLEITVVRDYKGRNSKFLFRIARGPDGKFGLLYSSDPKFETVDHGASAVAKHLVSELEIFKREYSGRVDHGAILTFEQIDLIVERLVATGGVANTWEMFTTPALAGM